MDCLVPNSGLDLRTWEIRTAPDVQHSGDRPPIFLGSTASVTNSLVGRGCVISGEVAQSIIFSGAHIGKGACVRDSIVMQNTVVADGCRVE